MSYKAVIARIKTRPFPGADNLVIGSVCGYQVLVNKDTPDDTMGIFFEQGGQLSEEFASTNDLVRRKDADGKACGGFFEENRRVRAIKLRGARSDGFWCPLSYLAHIGTDLQTFAEGDLIDAINGHLVCSRYETSATVRARTQGNRTSGKSSNIKTFPRHVETESLRKCVGTIPLGAVCHVSTKLHGTSFRFGRVRTDAPVPGWKGWLLRLLRLPATIHEWVYVNGTRNVVLGEGRGEGYRLKATQGIQLHQGEVLYGELVGYTDAGALIMSPQSTKGLKDKSITRRFGDLVTYAYGCLPGQCRMYVYRIVQYSSDGHPVELSWNQVVARCSELGLKTVPHIKTFVYDGAAEGLREWASLTVNGSSGTDPIPSELDTTHPEEGIVLRWESPHGVGWLKEKSWVFGVLEGYLKESDDYVDAEESA